MGIIDSRSVKTSHHVDSVRGLDGNKKIKGRKQHIIVDGQGYLMSVAVHEDNVHNSKGAPKVIERLSCKLPRLAKILANGGCRVSFVNWVFINSNGNLKSFSDLMNVHQNSRSYRNDGLLEEHTHGRKTAEG